MRIANPFKSFDPRLAAELRSQKKSIYAGLACTIVTASLTGLTVWIIRNTIDSIETLARLSDRTGPDSRFYRDWAMTNLWHMCAVVVVVFGAKYWFTRGQVFYLSQAANKLAADLRVRMFTKLLRLPVSYFNERRSGAIQSVLTNDVNVYQNAVGIIRDSIDGPIKSIASLVAIVIIQWPLALLSILLIPVMGVVIQRNSKKMKRAQAQVQEDLATVSAETQEVLQGTRVVKAFGAEDRTVQSYSQLVNQSFQSQMTAVERMASLRPLVELIGAVALSIFFYLSGRLAAAGRLHVADVAALVFAMDAINQGFRSLSGVSNTYATVQAASERIHSEVLDVPEQHEVVGGRSLPSPSGRVEFEGVSFAYPDGTLALTNVSFIIEPGTSLALVGPSGAGKTTIADLLLRFYDPTSGRITLDGIDIRELDVAWLRSHIGVVPQHTFLFAGSIEDNVRLGTPDASESDVKEALAAAHATEFSTEMAQRTTSELGERGVRLSGGQMQRIAIARALVRKPTILLLDEATSALDATSEKAVTEALDEIMKERTTLFIAHRLTTAARADRILVLSRGEVVETGSHGELMTANGPYAGLFRAFSGGVLEG